jgi:tetratricopeptide (TPR) repeat protein
MTPATSLANLLRVDQQKRWRRGESIRVEAYLEEHPALRGDDEGILDLIYNEIMLREECGDSPEVSEYLQRFTRLAPQIQDLFEVHLAVESEELGHSESLPRLGHSDETPGPSQQEEELPDLPGYEVLGEVGRGGMGIVYKARQRSLDRVIALKMLRGGPSHKEERVRFQAEAILVARLQHPNIVQVHEVGEHAGRPFFVMEYVEGQSLAAFIGGRPQPARKAAQLVGILARAMHFAHTHHILHRDLKPANVLLTAAGDAKITDFGLAKHLRHFSGQTRTGDVLGTPSYMAPEQAASQPDSLSAATDVYALGAVLYEMLTGRPPFHAETPLGTLSQVLYAEPVPPSRLRAKTPRDLETVCLKCLEKAPGRRYPSAAELADDLDRFCEGRPVRARRVTPWGRTLRWARRRPALAGLLGVSAATVLALLTLWRWYDAREHQRGRAARAEVQEVLADARSAFAQQDWRSARSGAAAALARIEAEPYLADLRTQAERLFQDAQRRQSVAETFRAFIRASDEAFFNRMEELSHGQNFLGMERTALRKATEKAAREALDLVAAGKAPANAWEVAPGFDAAQRAVITANAYPLLLILADTLGESAETGGTAWAEALRILDRAARLGPPTRVYHLRRASYLRRLGNEQGAAEESRQAEAQAKTPHEYFILGDEYYKQGDLPRAIGAYEQAVRLQPDHFWGHCCLARCLIEQKQWERARTSLSVCQVVRPDAVWPHLLRGFVNGQLHAFADAGEDFKRAEALLQDRPGPVARYGFYVHRGVLRFEAGEPAAAASDFREAIRLQPDLFMAYLNLARVCQRQGRPEEADKLFRDALRLHPPAGVLASYHAERGRDLYRAGRYEEAVAACTTALAQQLHFAYAQGVLGMALLKLRRYDQAARAFDGYLEQGGLPMTDVFLGRGHARLQQGDFLGARDDYNQALRLNPDAKTYCQRGWAYFFADAWRPAERDFEEALRLDPGLGDAYTGRGLARVMLGQYALAVGDAEEGLRRKPATPEMMHNLACIFAQAVARAREDPGRADRATLAQTYRNRALHTIRRTLDLIPARERPAFWRDKICPDKALDPIRDSPDFRRLSEEHGARPGDS